MFRKLTALLILVAALAAILLVAPASAQEDANRRKATQMTPPFGRACLPQGTLER